MSSHRALLITTLILGMGLSGCVEPTSQQPEPTPAVVPTATPAVAPVSTGAGDPVVTDGFAFEALNWSETGGVKFRWTAIERGGEVYICGAHTGQGSPNMRKLNREVLRQARVQSNGETILRDIRFFKEVSNANWSTDLVGVATQCKSTGRTVAETPLTSIQIAVREGNYSISL